MGSEPVVTQMMMPQRSVLPCLEPSDFHVHVGTSELAEHLGISIRRVTELVQDGILPREQRGKFDLRQCSKAYIAFLARPEVAERRAAAIGLPGHKKITHARADLMQAQAERAQLKLARERGELLPVAEVRDFVGSAFRTVRDRFLTMPAFIAPYLVGRTEHEIQRELDRMVREILTTLVRGRESRLSETLQTSANSSGPEDTLQTSANLEVSDGK